jgi:hypothetical protein
MTNELTEEERRDLVELGARPVEAKRALDLIDSLTTQCQRDYQLAAAWQARHEALRVETTFERDRLTARLAELEHANTEAAKTIRTLTDERDAAERNEKRAFSARAERAESECAALRTANAALQTQYDTAFRERADAESECAALRAEVERQAFNEARIHVAYREQLAAANALLERCQNEVWMTYELSCLVRAHIRSARSGQAKAEPSVAEPLADSQRSLEDLLKANTELREDLSK